MKNKIFLLGFFILIIAAVLFSSFGHFQKDLFYYAFNEKIFLEPVPGKYVLRYANSDVAKSKLAVSERQGNFRSEEWKDERTLVVSFLAVSQNDLIAGLLKDPDVQSLQPLYRTVKEKSDVASTDEILVRFKKDVSNEDINGAIKNYRLAVVKKGELFYTFSATRDVNTLQVANAIMESGIAEFSHPNFYRKVEMLQLPNDEYFNFQWNLNNTGQVINDGHTGTPDADIDAPEAWQVTQGSSNIIIAVLDEGVTSNHPDLPNTRQIRLNGSNFSTSVPGNDPSPVGDGNHGNACSGIIAATRNNGQGIAGVAPNCKIMPIKILNPSANDGNIANAISFAKNHGAHVLSNSWGYGSDNPNLVPAVVAAIQDAVTNGRNGRGCVVVFAAGNTANHVSGFNGFVTFPGNVNIPGVLTVAASDRFDKQSNYSPTGVAGNSANNQKLDIAAPSHRAYPSQIPGEDFEIWSMDIPGNSGYNPQANNVFLPASGTQFKAYTGRMGGTSAACPQVAGAAALVLSLRPNMRQMNVFNTLTRNADKVGGYTYNTSGLSKELGFGRLNLNNAVQAASRLSSEDNEGIITKTSLLKTYQTGKQLHVELNDNKDYMLTVSNSFGQVLIHTKMVNQTNIPVNSYKQGMYYIRLVNSKDKTNYSSAVMIR